MAVATALIVGLGWVGATWYTGKRIVTQIQQSLAQSNQTLHLLYPGVNLVLDKANYQRCILPALQRRALYGEIQFVPYSLSYNK